MRLFLSVIFSIGVSVSGFGNEISSIEKVGAHHRLFAYEKNENNQNILVVYTQLESNCQIRLKNGKPVLDYYWLMDRQRYKPVAPLIRRKLRQRLEVKSTKSPDAFEIKLKDLRELETNLQDITVHVQAYRDSQGLCAVKATLPTPFNPKAILRLEMIHAEAQRTWNPLDRKLISVALNGVDDKTGDPLRFEFQAKKK